MSNTAAGRTTYRQDVPNGTQPGVMTDVIRHVREHLSAVVSPIDSPTAYLHEVKVRTQPWENDDNTRRGVSVIGTIDRLADAHYLKPDYDPAADHPDIKFTPYHEPGTL